MSSFRSLAAAAFTATALLATPATTVPAGAAPVQIAAGNPADAIGSLKSKLASAKKKARSLVKSAEKYRKRAADRNRSAAKLRQDIAAAKKDQKAVDRRLKALRTYERQLDKFKNAPLLGPAKSAYKAARKSLKSVRKQLESARGQFKKALVVLRQNMRAQNDAARTVATAAKPLPADRESTQLLTRVKGMMAKFRTGATASSRAAMAKLSSSQRRKMAAIGRMVAAGNAGAAQSQMRSLLSSLPKGKARQMDVNGLVQAILRESYLQQQQDLRQHADKLKAINARKAKIRAAMAKMRSRTDQKGLARDLEALDADAKLANMQLQKKLQQQQQVLQTMSNVSKMLHDTAMSIIRKIG